MYGCVCFCFRDDTKDEQCNEFVRMQENKSKKKIQIKISR